MGWGKHFSSMYSGSLYGSGIHIFAVWGYVIANMLPNEEFGAVVELNPVKMRDTFGGCELETVEAAVKFLCDPDERSTTPDEGGRRLVNMGGFQYRVVNGAKYMAIRNDEERRRQNREAQARWREAHPEKKPRKRRAAARPEPPIALSSNGSESGEEKEARLDRKGDERLRDQDPVHRFPGTAE